MEHIYEKHQECDDQHCDVCDGGLAICVVCGGAEGTLTTDCQGRAMSEEEQEAVHKGQIDFVEGRWITLVTRTAFTQWYQDNNIISFYGANIDMAHVAFNAGLEKAASLSDPVFAAKIRQEIK